MGEVDRGLSTSCVRCETTINPSIRGDEYFRLVEFHREKEVGQNAGAVWGNPGVNQPSPYGVYSLNSLPSSKAIFVGLVTNRMSPPLCRCSLHFPSGAQGLTSFHHLGNSVSRPLFVGLPYKTYLELGNQDAHFCLLAVSQRRVELYVVIVSS